MVPTKYATLPTVPIILNRARFVRPETEINWKKRPEQKAWYHPQLLLQLYAPVNLTYLVPKRNASGIFPSFTIDFRVKVIIS